MIFIFPSSNRFKQPRAVSAVLYIKIHSVEWAAFNAIVQFVNYIKLCSKAKRLIRNSLS